MIRPPPDRRPDHQQSSLLLSVLVLNLLRTSLRDFGSPISIPSPTAITPTGLASLMLGMSLSLMFCGSLTFFIGFMLIPSVLAFPLLLYVAGVVSALSFLARSILCFAITLPSFPQAGYGHLPVEAVWSMVEREGTQSCTKESIFIQRCQDETRGEEKASPPLQTQCSLESKTRV
ncbi:hypothetical protein MLD38_040360 [Melastoma candidum]|uniref:Uncharacterized protein n=1 Tax=Melastoma candidum TaxID=119954 RepID=A0ACB9L5H0_9MYRT|nr:hypothetical protein MLD38_040360 [Melastoma candidum]